MSTAVKKSNKKTVEKEIESLLLSLRNMKKYGYLTCRIEEPMKKFVEQDAKELNITVSEYIFRLLLARLHSKMSGCKDSILLESINKNFK